MSASASCRRVGQLAREGCCWGLNAAARGMHGSAARKAHTLHAQYFILEQRAWSLCSGLAARAHMRARQRCHHVQGPWDVVPVDRYYFYNEGASVEAVLKGANLVDITAIKAQIASSKADVLQGLTGSFTWV